MKNLYVSILFTFVAGVIVAQQSKLSGKITDLKTGEPIVGATVYLQPYSKGTTTDFDGDYSIENLKKGDYQVRVSYVGFEAFEENIIVKENESLQKNYSLKEAVFELQTVEITGRKRTSYKPDVTYAGAKVAVDVKDVPQSIAVLNKEVIKDQGLFRIDKVTENIAGVTQTREGNNFTSRGFRVGHDFINGNRALLGAGFSASSIATQYERVEFIKGPAAAIFGNSSPGGVVNAVTKKPLAEDRADISFSYGSFETKRATLDITGPLNEEKTLLYRTNVAWENSGTFSDFRRIRSNLFAPSLSYVPNDKTRINIDIVGTINNDTAGLYRGIPVLQNDLSALPISYNAAEPYDYQTNNSLLYTVSATHKFFDGFILNTSYTRSDFKQDFIETRSNNQFTEDGSELIRVINDRRVEGASDFVTAYLIGEFKTGALTHKALLGGDFYQTETLASNRAATGEVNGVPNLSFSDRVPIAAIGDLLVNFSEVAPTVPTSQSYKGVYLQDLIEVGKFKILAALRYEKLASIETSLNDMEDVIADDVFLPRFGITYSLNDQVNIYASYTEGFEQQVIPSLINVVEPGETFDPYTSNQIEVGTKVSFFKDKLLGQLSLYNITRSGRLLADSSGSSFFGLQLGDEISRGLEAEMTGNLTSNISLSVNYAFNEVEFDQDDLEAIERLESLLNTSISNNPKHTAGFWGKYKFKNKALRNFGIGLGARYVSGSVISNNTIISNERAQFIEFPEYFTFKQGFFYNNRKIDVTLNVNNIFDERYYIGGIDSGRVFAGAPRNFLLTVGYKF